MAVDTRRARSSEHEQHIRDAHPKAKEVVSHLDVLALETQGTDDQIDQPARSKKRHTSEQRKAAQRKDKEKPLWEHAGWEVRELADGSWRLRFTAIAYRAITRICDPYEGDFFEQCSPRAASAALKGDPDVKFLFDHGGIPLGSTRVRSGPGAVKLYDSDEALRGSIILDPDQPSARDLGAAVRSGAVSQMSFGFSVGQEKWSSDWTSRTIESISRLYDVSAVTWGAYGENTSVSIATADEDPSRALGLELDALEARTARLARIDRRLKGAR